MKLAMTGDLHLTEGPRFADTLGVLDWFVEDTGQRGAEAYLIGGDVAGHDAPHEMTKAEENALSRWVQRLAARGPVLWLLGNHDRAIDFVPFTRLDTVHPVTVVTTTQIVELPPLRVYALPYPSKLWAVAADTLGASIAEQKQSIEQALRAILLDWRIRASAAPEVAHVGLMHVNVAGSLVGGGEQHIGREVELAPHDLTELGFAGGLLSHIHKPQEPAPGWWYAGSPSAQNFGEVSDRKSYILADVGPGRPMTIERIPTPARRLVTIEDRWEQGRWAAVGMAVTVRDADVRARLWVPEEQLGVAPVQAYVESVQAQGAHTVQLDRRIIPTTRVRSEQILTAVTTEDKVRAYFASVTPPPSAEQVERCVAKLAILEER